MAKNEGFKFLFLTFDSEYSARMFKVNLLLYTLATLGIISLPVGVLIIGAIATGNVVIFALGMIELAIVLFAVVALCGAFASIAHLFTRFTDEEYNPQGDPLAWLVAILAAFGYSYLHPSEKANLKQWWIGLIFKLSVTTTALTLSLLPLLMILGALPVSMLGIVTFGGLGAVVASVGFLAALPLLATMVFFLLLLHNKAATFLSNHKTQIVFWALGTATAAVLLTLFLPSLALPGLTTTTTLALIIVGASAAIAIGELVTLTGIVNVVARWVLALVADKSQGQSTPTENASTMKNTSILAYTASAITGAPIKDYEQIRKNNFHCSRRTFFIPVAGPEPAGNGTGSYQSMSPSSDE